MPQTAVVETEAHSTIGQSLTVAALGVVYGDIGTSPLYAMKQCFASGAARSPSRASSACCR